MIYIPVPPWRRDFDCARDPLTARNALGIVNGTSTPAPIGAEYITGSPDPTLTNERVLTNTATVTWDLTTPGQVKANAATSGGNVSNSGTPTSGQYAKWVTATTIQGVSTATVLSDIGAAPVASPTFTGDPKAPTPATADNDTSIATTAYVQAQSYLTSAGAAAAYQPLDADLTAIAGISGVQGDIIYRNASAWTRLGAGTSGQYLQTGGAGANPSWATLAGGGNVSNSGTPTANQFAQWTDATHIQGVAERWLRYDTSQGLTQAQQGLALANAGAAQFNLINGKVVESHASNAATFAIKTLTGSDPSSSDPVMVMFPDASQLTLTAAISITIPSTATLGTINALPFRLWFTLINDTGTPRIAARQCVHARNSSSKVITGFAPDVTTAISPIGNGAVTTYAATTISTARPHRIIAYADYESGLATAGTWNASPTRIMHIGANGPWPGQVIGIWNATSFAANNTTSTTPVVSTIALTVAPGSVVNGLEVVAMGDAFAATGGICYAGIYRGTTALQNASILAYNGNGGGWSRIVLDFPDSTAGTSYYVKYYTSNVSYAVYCPWTTGDITIREIMG